MGRGDWGGILREEEREEASRGRGKEEGLSGKGESGADMGRGGRSSSGKGKRMVLSAKGEGKGLSGRQGGEEG